MKRVQASRVMWQRGGILSVRFSRSANASQGRRCAQCNIQRSYTYTVATGWNASLISCYKPQMLQIILRMDRAELNEATGSRSEKSRNTRIEGEFGTKERMWMVWK